MDAPQKALLIVDDDAVITATVGVTLRHAGYTTYEATQAERALEICASQPLDLAILDNRLPTISGPELAKVLFDRYSLRSIFLSAHGSPELVEQAVRVGALGYLVKPVDPPNLLPMVRAALGLVEECRALRAREAQMKDSLLDARDINTAVGVLMERLRLQQELSFACLRNYARANRRRVVDVARELLQPINDANQAAAQMARFLNAARRDEED